MTLGHKKKNRASYQIFSKLVNEDSDNFHYQRWLNYAKVGLYNWLFTRLTVIGGGVVFVNIAFSVSDTWPFDLGIVGLGVILLSVAIRKGFGLYFEKKQ